MCNELIVCFDGVATNATITHKDGVQLVTALSVIDFVSTYAGYEIRENHNLAKQLTYTKDKPEFKSVTVGGVTTVSSEFVGGRPNDR